MGPTGTSSTGGFDLSKLDLAAMASGQSPDMTKLLGIDAAQISAMTSDPAYQTQLNAITANGGLPSSSTAMPQMYCGTGVNPNLPQHLRTLNVTAGVEAMSKTIVETLVNSVDGAMQLVSTVGAKQFGLDKLSNYQLQAIGIAKCLVKDNGLDFQYLINFVFYVLKMVGKDKEIVDMINQQKINDHPAVAFLFTCAWDINHTLPQLMQFMALARAMGKTIGDQPANADYINIVLSDCTDNNWKKIGNLCNTLGAFYCSSQNIPATMKTANGFDKLKIEKTTA